MTLKKKKRRPGKHARAAGAVEGAGSGGGQGRMVKQAPREGNPLNNPVISLRDA